jgi:hypothetical protein
MHSNHMNMTKFEHVEEEGFRAVTGVLHRWVKELAVPDNASEPESKTSEQGEQFTQSS